MGQDFLKDIIVCYERCYKPIRIMKWHTSKQFFSFWLIDAILWLLTRNAGVVQFCQKIQFHREGDFKWFRTGSLDIRGTFGSRPEP